MTIGMTTDIALAKMIASVAISVAVGMVGCKTKDPKSLWALFFVAIIWQ